MEPTLAFLLTAARKDRGAQFNRIARAAFEKFTIAKRNFYLNLSPADLAKIGQTANEPKWRAATRVRSHIEFLLTLRGLKPCTLFAHYNPESRDVNNQLINTCLMPIMNGFRLNELGFELRQITHDMPTTIHRGFRDGWVFADRSSERYALVQEVFFTNHHGAPVNDFEVGKALGYQVEAPKPRAGTITFFDVTEKNEISKIIGTQVDDVYAFEYTGPGQTQFDLDLLLMHYAFAEPIFE